MRRGGTGSIAILAAMVLAALLLVACGSSDSGSSSTAGSSTEASGQDNGSGGGTEGENDAGEAQPEAVKPENDSKSGSGKTSSGTGFTAAEVEAPLKVSGGGSGQFRRKGGDNSIQEFGDEKGESELQEAAETVHSFFVARATGEWAKACGYVSKAMTEQLEQLATNTTSLKDKGCAPFLEAFTSELPAGTWRQITAVDAGSLRQEGEQAFLIYYGEPEKTVYAMPMKVEDGEFKVGALSGDAIG